MRFIDRKDLKPPSILSEERVEAVRREVRQFIELTLSKGETRRVPSPRWLDELGMFRQAMALEFGCVCAYCERKAIAEGNGPLGVVGRQRPEALAQDENGRTELLAYAWLMYEWENLHWLCGECSRHKNNLYFIRGERGGPFATISELRKNEKELILDPTFHQPDDHLAFGIDGLVKALSPEGAATCELLHLNRPDLQNERQKAVWDLANSLRDVRQFNSYRFADNWGALSNHKGGVINPHLGSARNAIMGFARLRGMIFDNIVNFLMFFSDLSAQERNAFVDDLQRSPDHSGEQEVMTPPENGADNHPKSKPLPRRHLARQLQYKRQLENVNNPITKVKILNFKALNKIVLKLPEKVAVSDQAPCMLLLGENGSGKSTILEAMALSIIGAPEAMELDRVVKHEDLSPKYFLPVASRDTNAVFTAPLHVRLDFLDSDEPAILSAQIGDETFSGSLHCSKVVLAYGPRRYFSSRQTRRMQAPARRVQSLFDPMHMIPNPIYWLAELRPKQFTAAARALREVLMLDEDDDIELSDKSPGPPQIFIRRRGHPVAMSDLSAGYKSVIAMVCDIIRELLNHFDNIELAAAVVFIDEIETHLHPRWKMRIMMLLRRAFPQVQFIVTTHDPLCLRGMNDGEVFVLHRNSETDQIELVPDLPSIRGMRAEQILTSEFFGLGTTDPETDARLTKYNRLAAKVEYLSDAEHAEMARLSQQLESEMVLGSTLREQAYAEALRARVDRRKISPTKVASPRRAELRQRFLTMFHQEQE